MKRTKGMIGLVAFIACSWAVVVTTYAAQVKNEYTAQVKTEASYGKEATLIPMQSYCPTSSTSSSGGE